MATIKAKTVPKKESTSSSSVEYTLARFCYHFQQYQYHEAKKIPHKRIKLMLKIAEKEEAIKMFNILQIIASQHTKKLSGIKKLTKYYQSIVNA